MIPDPPETDPPPPPDQLRQLLAAGLKPRQLLYATTALGVFDVLQRGPATAAELAPAVGADADALRRAVRGLVALDVLAEGDDGRFALTPVSALLGRDVPGSLRGEVLLVGERDRAWTGLLDGLQTGQTPFALVFGEDLFAHLARDPDLGTAFHTWMAAWADDVAAIAAACPLPPTGLVVDIGGGRGDLLIALLRRKPALQGVLVDAAAEAAGAAAFLTAAGVAPRCRVEVGDFFTAVPAGGALYVLCRILHDWDDGRARQILDRCHAAMAGSGCLVTIEKLLPERVATNPSAVFLDLDMAVEVGGRQRSAAEFRVLLAQHGFQLTRTIDRGGPPASWSRLRARPRHPAASSRPEVGPARPHPCVVEITPIIFTYGESRSRGGRSGCLVLL